MKHCFYYTLINLNQYLFYYLCLYPNVSANVQTSFPQPTFAISAENVKQKHLVGMLFLDLWLV